MKESLDTIFHLKYMEAPELCPDDSLLNFSDPQSGKVLSDCLKGFLKNDAFPSWGQAAL